MRIRLLFTRLFINIAKKNSALNKITFKVQAGVGIIIVKKKHETINTL